jgi:hypothetical protein
MPTFVLTNSIVSRRYYIILLAARQQGFYQTFKGLTQPTLCAQLTLSTYDSSRGLLPGIIYANIN